MLRALFMSRVRAHGERILKRLFPGGYGGELFLCGAAFAPLLKRRLPVEQVDLWVRSREERRRLLDALKMNGAHEIDDPDGLSAKFKFDGQRIEVMGHSVGEGTLMDVIRTYDLAL